MNRMHTDNREMVGQADGDGGAFQESAEKVRRKWRSEKNVEFPKYSMLIDFI